MPSKSRVFGDFGQKIAEMFLVKRGFTILARNFLTRYGEVDLIFLYDNQIRFIEVKTVRVKAVSCGTYMPEQNLHRSKIQKMNMAAHIFLASRLMLGMDFHLDGCIVRIVESTKGGRKGERVFVKYIPDINL